MWFQYHRILFIHQDGRGRVVAIDVTHIPALIMCAGCNSLFLEKTDAALYVANKAYILN